MKTKEQELDLLTFQEISDFEKKEIEGGTVGYWDPVKGWVVAPIGSFSL